MSKDPLLYIIHISEAADRVFKAITRSPNIFFEDIDIQNAVYRYFEVIGEAAGRVPEEFKIKYSKVNWQGMKDLRNVIIHQYDGIDPNNIWTIIHGSLTENNRYIKEILKESGII